MGDKGGPAAKGSHDLLLPFLFSLCFLFLYAYGAGLSSLTFDEAATYQFARLDWQTFALALRHGDAFYGLYYALMHFWINCFGSSEFALRLPSVVFGAAALMLVHSLTLRLFDRSTAWITTSAIALNPFFYMMTRDARPYTLFFFISLATSRLLLQAFDTPTRRSWVAYMVACIVGMYVHLFMVFVIIAHGIYILWVRKKSDWMPYLTAAATCALTSLPLAWLTLHDDNSQNTWLERPTLHTIRELFFIWSGSHQLEHLELIFGIIAFAVFAKNVWLKQNEHEINGFTFSAIWLLVPMLFVFTISQKRPIYFQNYMISELFAFTAIVSYGIKNLRFRLILGPALALFWILNFNAVHAEAHSEMQSWREGVRQLARDIAPRDAILLYPPRGYAVFEYYAPRLAHGYNNVAIIYPKGGLPIWLSELTPFKPDDPVREAVGRHKRVWLVLNGLSGYPEPGEAELERALRRSYTFGPSYRLTRLRIVKLTWKGPHARVACAGPRAIATW